jgi:hypothetical protein
MLVVTEWDQSVTLAEGAAWTKAGVVVLGSRSSGGTSFPSLHGTKCTWLHFLATPPNGDRDHQLNIIQIKKIKSFFSGYHDDTSPMITWCLF